MRPRTDTLTAHGPHACENKHVTMPLADGRGDAFVFFVGSRNSGKSTLLNRFLYPARVSTGMHLSQAVHVQVFTEALRAEVAEVATGSC